MVTKGGEAEEDVKIRISKANAVFNQLYSGWKNGNIYKKPNCEFLMPM